ncbi:unnamed protein product, partial [Iphiclides podalirius]
MVSRSPAKANVCSLQIDVTLPNCVKHQRPGGSQSGVGRVGIHRTVHLGESHTDVSGRVKNAPTVTDAASVYLGTDNAFERRGSAAPRGTKVRKTYLDNNGGTKAPTENPLRRL